MKIEGQRVLLTGATGGIGQVIARALAARGASLILSGRRLDALQPLADQLGAEPYVADLADRAAVTALAEHARGIDVLIANAALPSSGEALDYTPEQIERALEVNLHAPVLLARRLAPQMVEAGRGHIVFVGSISGKVASPGSAVYNAAKFGLRGFALALRQDLHGTGVGVSLVQPGFVREVGMFAQTGAKVPGGSRTVSAGRVASATLKAIEHNHGEVNVAPVEMRIASSIGAVFPELSGLVQRRVASGGALDQIIAAQRDKR